MPRRRVFTEALTYQLNTMCCGTETTLHQFWARYGSIAHLADPADAASMNRLLTSRGGYMKSHLNDLQTACGNKLGHAMFGHALPQAQSQRLVAFVKEQCERLAGDGGIHQRRCA